MYKNILCPIDGSATSNQGLVEAARLAKGLNAIVHILHVVDYYFPVMNITGDVSFIDMTKILNENGKKILKKAENTAKKAEVSFDTKMVSSSGGQISKSILEYVDICHADLIVMGTHGLRGVKRLMMGSDAETVLRTSSVPVLLVRSNVGAKKKPSA